MPRLGALCLAWADVYDEGRAASWSELHEPAGGAQRSAALPYPHRVFTSTSAANAWLDGV